MESTLYLQLDDQQQPKIRNEINTRLSKTERNLLIVGAVNAAYVILQISVAFQTGSLAMLSDAFHNFSDVGAAFIAFKCERLRYYEATEDLPFGYLRLQVSLWAFAKFLILIENSLTGYRCLR